MPKKSCRRSTRAETFNAAGTTLCCRISPPDHNQLFNFGYAGIHESCFFGRASRGNIRLARVCIDRVVGACITGKAVSQPSDVTTLAADSNDRAQLFQSDAAQRSNLIARM
ncbi:hypothetical protein [Bradyrhizobium sp. RDI18]|uniref:hypothetical protein n=1 Tax=Bradyrhizobium sp. RDI18 TaxID=3367400 RepID=UPI00371FC5F2